MVGKKIVMRITDEKLKYRSGTTQLFKLKQRYQMRN